MPVTNNVSSGVRPTSGIAPFSAFKTPKSPQPGHHVAWGSIPGVNTSRSISSSCAALPIALNDLLMD
ncbi:hypothetical protein C449_17446 [Halococcus saccharolyticus DSM 5350]|uniref:Uncharacterized protein n=1 Tax=Halococcus saccharolyticus DSM 5350 TaxID=1227455 RepID=M0MDD5_9EURY|nr:hypothetical protein C449_17446 [Halococcus saccharolyticus DSM 5350]